MRRLRRQVPATGRDGPEMTRFHYETCRRSLLQPVDGSILGLFRIVWGLLMCAEVNWLHNQLRDFHDPDVLHFYYQGFSWIRHFPSPLLMEIELIAMLFAALFVAAGFFFRGSTIVFTVLYGHFFFAESITYNNHFYLILLVSGLLACTSAGARLSVDERRRQRRGIPQPVVPLWNYAAIRAQVAIVYVYGAIAKISRDWLVEYEPVRFWLNHTPRPPAFLKAIIVQEWVTPFVAWSGLFIDLLCPFLLLWKRTRLAAVIVLLLFHAINSQLFNIGLFPLIGIALLIPFFRPRPEEAVAAETPPAPRGRALAFGLGAFFIFQLLFPLRWHLWRPADPLWTEKGQRFAWRMMLREKLHYFEVYFPDPAVRRRIQERPWLIPRVAPSAQLKLGQNPYYLWQYVQAIERNLKEYGMEGTAIHVLAACSLNGRPFHPIVDPHRDLAAAECPLFRVPDWILPLPEMKIDFARLEPFSDTHLHARKALETWIRENPGAASSWISTTGPGR